MSEISIEKLRKAITGDSDLSGASLATRILLSRLRREVARDPGTLTAGTEELSAFFSKNAFASNDLATL